MPETLPMLEKDPRADFKTSRALRVLVFSFLASATLVSLFIIVFRFVYDRFVAEPLGRGPYQSNPLFIIPSILLIAAIIGKLLWDAAEGRQGRPMRR